MWKTITVTLFLWKNNAVNYKNNSLAENNCTRKLVMGDDSNYTVTIGDSTYSSNESYTDGTFTINLDQNTDYTSTIDTTMSENIVDIDWLYKNITIDPSEVERMCKEYPSLEKVWRNFKSVYDMVKQDYEGKKKAGEVDNGIPF